MIPDRLAAALADRYRIERELGQGGMATVYLAEDLKHKRRVAVKVLKPELAAVLGAERFVQEITTTAALQHPHILPLFDSGEADGFLFYVMPFIDGETLRDKLDRETQFGVDDAVKIAREVADALHYAHTQGVIHRDIKPENILLANGRPMVADFGIALAVSAAAGGRMTETGLSLGTPHYMSPEQATAEKDISARADVYSLASVLYEMLAGQPPHLGGSAQQIIMKIITEQAQSVTALRKSVPTHVAAALAKALEKLPADRFGTAAEFAAALANPGFTVATTRVGSTRAAARSVNALTLALGAALVAVSALAGWALLRPAAEPPVARFNVRLPAGQEIGGFFSRIALTPDGSRLIYSAGVGSNVNLWVRERDQLEGKMLAGTAGAGPPFVSPDGSRVGFLASGRLNVISLRGGPPVVVGDSAVGGIGATWSPDGFIYSDGAGSRGLVRVPAAGGRPSEPFTQLDSASGDVDHRFPDALPNGRGVLFVVTRSSAASFDIAVATTETGAHEVLLRGVFVRYAKSGHLVYVTADGSLMAVPFDQDAMQLTGDPVALAGGITLRTVNAPDLAIADDGTLMYTVGGGGASGGEPVWVGRDGRAESVAAEWTRNATSVALSPDGTQLAASIGDATESHLWIRRLTPGGTASKLTFTGSINYRPAWTPDGRTVLFVTDVTGDRDIFSRRADGTAQAELVLHRSRQAQEVLMTRDGSWRVYRLGGGTQGDIFAQRTSGDTTQIMLANSEFAESGPTMSPDGRWLAYVSNETGQHEVYVRPFPQVSGGKWLISEGGGREPLWSRDGRELFYRNGTNEMVAVAVSTGSAAPPTGAQRVLFSAAPYVTDFNHRMYDVTPDGRRFVMLRLDTNDRGAAAAELVVVQNFFSELKRMVPPR
jgi:tRNA A-37 threonylcarbamoyl transferase component Bud32/WD40 repeat protein